MCKALMSALFLATALGGVSSASQAREFEVWGHKFSGGDEVEAPAPQRFNSIVVDPDRRDEQRRPIDELGR